MRLQNQDSMGVVWFTARIVQTHFESRNASVLATLDRRPRLSDPPDRISPEKELDE